MTITLNEQEKNTLKSFFLENLNWMRLSEFSNEEDLIKLVNSYGEFLEKNNLDYDRNLLMFLVELKQELTRIKLTSSHSKKRRINILHPEAAYYANPTISKWRELCENEFDIYKKPKRELSKNELDKISMMLVSKLQKRDEQIKEQAVQKRKTA